MLGMSLRRLIPNSIVNNLKHFPMAVLANVRYGFPARGLVVIGVTGTDGKTTTVNMIYRILKDAGKKVAMVSTVKAVIEDQQIDTGFHVTSPTHFDMQKYIRLAKKTECEYLVLEVSSFALSQYRVWGIKFDIGVITNVTHEHLDYHRTWNNYLLAKSTLIKNTRIAVINRDEKHFSRLKKMAKGNVVSFGLSAAADFNPKKFPLTLRVIGNFNVLNGEAAAAVCANLGVSREEIRKSLNKFEGVEGRMNLVPNSRKLNIVIDYAHTPNGLMNALQSLKDEFNQGKLIAVIGAEGQRDSSKRRPMGFVGAKMADYLIITAVDPRGKLEQISAEIAEGAKKAGGEVGRNVLVINDRREAIRTAINELAKPGDVIGLFGKGHERSMNLDGKHEIEWSDLAEVTSLLK